MFSGLPFNFSSSSCLLCSRYNQQPLLIISPDEGMKEAIETGMPDEDLRAIKA
jgi:hypothetical protein